MEYRCISADSHIDLCWLPHDLFVSNATQATKDRMPYVVQGPEGPKWTTKSGQHFGLANGEGNPAGCTGSGNKYVAGKEHRLDRLADTGLFADGCKGIFRPTTPELRLQDQDRDGIQAEVLYGLHSSGNKIKDREAVKEFYRIYNDWLSDFCGHNRSRFIGLALIPSYNVDEAVAETRRIAKLGMGGLDFLASFDMTALWSPYWEPFWKAASEVNLPVHFHTIGGRMPVTQVPEDAPKAVKVASKASSTSSKTLYMATILSSVIHSGALERYPNLRIVLGESGIGWILYALERMDYEYENRFKNQGLPLKTRPSDYWRRQCRATFQSDYIGAKLLDDIGIENVMWASDYPHPDSVFPDSQEYIRQQFGRLPATTQRKIICENAGKFYGLM